jgi:Xaa-Pro aminopeptidase
MKEELELRIQRVQEQLRRKKLSGLIIEGRENSFYLSGFPCTASLILVTQKGAWFFTDSRYYTLAARQIAHMEVVLAVQRAFTQVADVARKQNVRKLGFEESAAYSQVKAMEQSFDWAELIAAGSILRDLRLVKSKEEQNVIARNQRLNQKILKAALTNVKPGQRETDVRNFILRLMIDLDCEEAFSTILAAGPNSANPHAVPGKGKVRPGELLLFDMGVKKDHYMSDMTRTVAVGEKLNPKCEEIYEVVRLAQAAGLRELGPGMPCKQVDAAARNVIVAAGYGDFFGHGLGHGVGLEIHEGPTLNPRSSDVLQPGMDVTVEPGIYLPEIGGVRIEDLCVITENGYQNLTSISKQLLQVA